MVFMMEYFFQDVLPYTIKKSMEFLSSLIFHTVAIQVIPHYYKQILIQ